MKLAIVLVAACAVLAGCATPVPQGSGPPQTSDKDTSYTVADTANGFTLAVAYSRYQFIPESSAVASACKQALTATAYEVADKRGRKIEPINEQRIRLSMGRNGFTGITSCEASAPIAWAK